MRTEPDRLLSLPAVMERTSLSRPTLTRLIAKGDFPASIRLTDGRRVAWSEAAITAWIASKLSAA